MMNEQDIHSKSLYKSLDGEKNIKDRYEELLKKWPVAYKSHHISTQFGTTFIIESGSPSQPPLVLLHGASSNSLSWMGDITTYCQYHQVFAIDIIGEPGFSDQTRPSLVGPGYSDWLAECLSYLNLSRVTIVGLSQGGWIALKFAVAFPEKVDKLVLLTPAGIVPTKASFIFKAILYSLLGKKGAEKLNQYVFGKQTIDPTALEFMNLVMTHFKSRMEKEYIFSDEELTRLSMPILLLGGVEDVIRSVPAIAERFKKFVSNLQLILIPDMGHVVVGVSNQIVKFTQQVSYKTPEK
jgi:pimeloyl-ACP methyl ester carboxylesterase